MNHHHGSLTVRTAVADALLANVSSRLGHDEIDAVLDCGFSSTLAAVRNDRPPTYFDEFPGRGAL